MIKFKDVYFKYTPDGKDILRRINFTLEAGSFHFLVGQSGAGKSSLMRLLSLNHLPSSGQVSMFEHSDISSLPRAALPAIRRRIGMVFQDFRLLPNLTAAENVALPLRIAGAKHTMIENYVKELLEWVGLREHMDAYPETLSGGQKQRVAIARAVIVRPDVILADEPTGNLDEELAIRIMRLFEVLNNDGVTILIATHNEQLIRKFEHPILRIHQGKLKKTTLAYEHEIVV
jgi:cell division transport system ATP-binding protein